MSLKPKRPFALLLLLAACRTTEEEPPPVCIDAGVLDPASCTPTYAPLSYSVVFEKTMKPTCAKSGISCHASTGVQGGLNFDDEQGSYNVLRQNNRVRAGEPACSSLVHRIVNTDGNFRMPPGANIAASEQCVIIQWIANGAPR